MKPTLLDAPPATVAAVTTARVLGLMVMTMAVVGCDTPTPQPAVCAAYEACYLTDGGKGLKTLAETSALDPETACYESYGGGGGNALIAELQEAYGEGGLCFTGGLQDGNGDDVSGRYVELCTAYCRLELEADCRRQRLGSTSICADPCGAADVDAAAVTDDLASCVIPSAERP